MIFKAHNITARDFCVIGYEGNEKFSGTLREIEAKYRPEVRFMEINTETIVNDQNKDSVPFYLSTDKKAVGSSIISDKENVEVSTHVKAVDIVEVVGRFEAAKVILLKIDIEGAEYNVMSKILASGALCRPGQKMYIAIEWHSRFGEDSVPKRWRKHNPGKSTHIQDLYAEILTKYCGVSFFYL